MKPIQFLFCVALLCGLATAQAASEASLTCVTTARMAAALDAPDYRKYAPSREIEITHLALDVTPDFTHRTLEAKATLRFKPTVKPANQLSLDAVDLNIHSLSASEKIESWQATDDKLVITFATPLPPGKEAEVTLAYSAEPTEGLYFRTPEMGYPASDTHLFSQGEEIEARHWYPCLDAPNQRFTSEITCRVPTGMTVISNGRLVSQTNDPASGLTVVHWSQEKPIANYLVSLVAGYFKKLEDKCGAIPLAFYTLPSESEPAANSFRDTKDMMEFFQQEIGVPYPWGKYDQTCVEDFVAGGMENVSATTLSDRTLYTAATENIHTSEPLLSHELAHQWFGDLVTCKDWSQVWLNEGFATYYETLYNEHKHGREALQYELYVRARQITGMTNDLNPIVRRTYDKPSDMFGYLVYPKASWVLHMLRCQLGDDLYRRCIQTYLQRHQYGNVVTEDLRAVIEELSGGSYDQFFDQWLYHGGFPELELTYAWDETAKLAKVSVRQTQEINHEQLLFNLPLTLRFKGKFGTVDREVQVTRKAEDFYVPLSAAPELVRVDPNYTLLAKIKLSLPGPLLDAQLADKTDMVGRLIAIEQLATQKDQETVRHLQEVLNHDSFYGVRLEAAKALATIHTPEALAALAGSTKQSDARVRQQVVEDLGRFYSDTAYQALRQVLEREKNPAIVAAALRGFGGYTQAEVSPVLLKFLGAASWRNELADGAIAAMRLEDDPVYLEPLLKQLSQHEADFTSRGLAQGLDTLAYLARNEDKKDAVRTFLIERTNHKRKAVQLASLKALGVLEDPKAIAVLEKFAVATKESPERTAAEQALVQVRAARKPADEYKSLRQEVEDLQKANRDLRQDLADLKKKIEARPGNPKTGR